MPYHAVRGVPAARKTIMDTRSTVLVIEDDAPIRRGIVDALGFAGFNTLQCANGAEALGMALECEIDLVLLDVMLPGMDGFTVLERLRDARPTLPVIMVTARGAEDDRIHGLTSGADDYVVKPFSARELLARVEAVLRRSPQRPGDVRHLRCAHCRIDLDRREASFPDKETITLSTREADLLRYLAAHRTRAVDRDELLQHVWGLNPRGMQTRTVDMQIARLRERLHGRNGEPIIQTVRGKGYMLCETVEIDSS